MSPENFKNFSNRENIGNENTPLNFLRSENGEVIEYAVKEKIRDITYHIALKGNKNNQIYRLDFNTAEYGEAVTNQGLQSFNEVVDIMARLVTVARKKDDISIIQLDASRNNFSKSGIEKISAIIETAYRDNPEIFNGFHYEEEGRSVDIRENMVLTKFSEKDVDEKGQIAWLEPVSNTISLEDLVASSEQFAEGFYNERELGDQLLRHIGYAEGMDPFLKNKNTETQRSNLYLRVLKQKFPDLPIEIDEFRRIIIHFKDDKDALHD